MLKLNLGCGAFPKESFINLDSRGDLSRIFHERHAKGDGPAYVIEEWSFIDDLLYDSGTVDAVTESHALMYLRPEDYVDLFTEIHRVLKPGGIFRITEDNCERPVEELKLDGLPWGTPASVTGPKMMRAELEKVFTIVIDVAPDKTSYVDQSLIRRITALRLESFIWRQSK